MHYLQTTLCLASAMVIIGCESESVPPPTFPTTPLKLAQWEQLPADEKYAAETLERLKGGEPKLRTKQGWKVFYEKTLKPGLAQEQANKTAQQ